jgi:23S rRNA (cytidine2498-2'-O)-methyltransferase
MSKVAPRPAGQKSGRAGARKPIQPGARKKAGPGAHKKAGPGAREPRAGARSTARPRAPVETRGSTRKQKVEARGSTRKQRVETRGSTRKQKVETRGSTRKQKVEAHGSARKQTKEPARGQEIEARGSAREQKREAVRSMPVALSQLGAEPHPGMWIFTTREGAEQDLVDELMLAKVVDPAPRVLGPALVLSPKLPKREGRPLELTFARQGFEILQSVKSHDLDEISARVSRSLRHQLAQSEQYALHVWVPDSRDANPLSALADELDARLSTALSAALPALRRVDDASLRRLASVKLAQVCLIDTQRAVAGVMHANRTPSLAKGGRTRVRVTGNFPSRAARKLEEALAWLGVAPGPGELCVDLGAAPGGWTFVLAERRAQVIAVDPAKLRPEILARKGVHHVQQSAFTFSPDGPVDWLFCDMAWRPLEAAALLAKWGRKRWARIMVANIKLPMIKKAELLARVRKILESEGDWKHIRAKQLYHDRDEITLTALRT